MAEEQELTAFVIRELGKHRRRRDIVMDVCERTGMDWPRTDEKRSPWI
jgi:hypothetical protein